LLVKRVFLLLNAAFELHYKSHLMFIFLPSKSTYELNITFLARNGPADFIGTHVYTSSLSTDGALCAQFIGYTIGCHFSSVADDQEKHRMYGVHHMDL
jgi:hypothetical protein